VSVFTEYEREVVTALVSATLPPALVESVLAEATLVSLETTGAGYFLTVTHPGLPVARTFCNKPLIVGRSGELECGFVVFVQDAELMLECHGWGLGLPDDFRTRDVVLTGL
jgi:hypothetical protein